jgi:hypothetical protein
VPAPRKRPLPAASPGACLLSQGTALAHPLPCVEPPPPPPPRATRITWRWRWRGSTRCAAAAPRQPRRCVPPSHAPPSCCSRTSQTTWTVASGGLGAVCGGVNGSRCRRCTLASHAVWR